MDKPYTDIVAYLRYHAETGQGDAHVTAGEAADEIERLRRLLRDAKSTIWMLRFTEETPPDESSTHSPT
jgi:hypothetical protein